MKKTFILLLIVLASFLVSCEKNETNANAQFNQAVDNFTFQENNSYITADFRLSQQLAHEKQTIEISWEITKGDRGAEIIDVNLVKITRPEYEEGDVTVELLATFTLGEFIKTKTYQFKVIAFLENTTTEKDSYVVYINIDGFAKYYYDYAVADELVSNLEAFKEQGVFFENLNTEFPSLTNPVQAMIISGTTNSGVENVYRYYDKTNDIVVQQARDNKAETIYQAAVRRNIPTATIRHFPAEDVLNTYTLDKLYVNVEQGKEANQKERFMQAIKLVKGEEFINGTTLQRVEEVPRLLTIYVDDVDGLGHNYETVYGIRRASNEEGRINNVLAAIEELDDLINQLVNAYKERGIYNKTAFFITTDHGMTPFGDTSWNPFGEYGKSKWPELRDKLKEINSSYIFEYLGPGDKPKLDTTVVGVSTGLQMLLTFKNQRMTNEQLDAIKSSMEQEYYIEEVLTRSQLNQLGVWRGANIDLLVIPKDRYHFHGRDNPNRRYQASGQHDTMLSSSKNIYGLIFGGLVKTDLVINDQVSVASFGVMMAEVLGFKLRDATTEGLDIFNNT
jgi:hypothetical protein